MTLFRLGLNLTVCCVLCVLASPCWSADPEPLTVLGVVGVPLDPAGNPEHAGVLWLWKDLLSRQDSGISGLGAEGLGMPGPTRKQWENLKRQFPGMAAEEQLRMVNGFFNRWSGLDDSETYGKKEYWACTREFLEKGGGDCEDYAFIKYQALRELHAKADELWLVLVTDVKRKADHAVLLARVGERWFVLDNLSSPAYLIMPADTYKKLYVPRFAFSGQAAWAFVPRPTDGAAGK